jgi:hypothetical protein
MRRDGAWTASPELVAMDSAASLAVLAFVEGARIFAFSLRPRNRAGLIGARHGYNAGLIPR